MSVPRFKNFGTIACHEGQPIDKYSGTAVAECKRIRADVFIGVIPPLILSSTFAQQSPGVLYEAGFDYSRSGNPTRLSFEKLVAGLEGGKFGLAFASGSVALSTILMMFPAGSHIITSDDVYGGTNRFFRNVSMAKQKMKVDFVDMTNIEKVKEVVTAETRLVWIESPTNPGLKICDIALCVEAVRAVAKEALIVADNTFASPYFQRPLSLGVDVVLNSVSKYINGHTDVIGGVVVMNDEKIYKDIKFLQNAIGGIPAPFDCYQAMRGAKTLHLRMEQHQKNAFKVAEMLEAHEKVEKVMYPGLKSHPQHDIATKQMTGYGGMVTMWLKGGIAESRQFLEALKVFVLAESLGGVDSMCEHPAIMTHASVPPEDRKVLGISDSMIRLSVGIEDIEDILGDLRGALDAVTLK